MRLLRNTIKYSLLILLFLALLWVCISLYSLFLFYQLSRTCEDVVIGMTVVEANRVVKEAGFAFQGHEVDYRYDVIQPFPKSEKTFEVNLSFDSDFSDFTCRIQHNGEKVVWAKMYDF